MYFFAILMLVSSSFKKIENKQGVALHIRENMVESALIDGDIALGWRIRDSDKNEIRLIENQYDWHIFGSRSYRESYDLIIIRSSVVLAVPVEHEDLVNVLVSKKGSKDTASMRSWKHFTDAMEYLRLNKWEKAVESFKVARSEAKKNRYKRYIDLYILEAMVRNNELEKCLAMIDPVIDYWASQFNFEVLYLRSLFYLAKLSYVRGDAFRCSDILATVVFDNFDVYRQGDLVHAISLFALVERQKGHTSLSQWLFEWGLDFIQDGNEKCSDDLAIILNDYGIHKFYQNKWSDALEYFEGSMEILLNLNKEGMVLAEVYNNLGALKYMKDDLVSAEVFFIKSLDLRMAMSPRSVDTSDSLNNLGIFFGSSGNYKRSLEYHRMALDIRRSISPYSIKTVSSLSNLGYHYSYLGNKILAKKNYMEAVEIIEHQSFKHEIAGTVYNNIGNIFSNELALDMALTYFNKAIEIYENIGVETLAYATALDSLAGIYSEKGDYHLAELYYHKALNLRQFLLPGGVEEAYSYAALSKLKHKNGRNSSSRDLMELAYSIANGLAPKSYHTLEYLGFISSLDIEDGFFHEAIMKYEYILSNLPEDTNSLLKAVVLLGLARAYRGLGNLDKADLLYEKSLGVYENNLLLLSKDHNVHARYRDENFAFVDSYVLFLMECGQPNEAFSIQEKFRSRSLLNLMKEYEIRGKIPKERSSHIKQPDVLTLSYFVSNNETFISTLHQGTVSMTKIEGGRSFFRNKVSHLLNSIKSGDSGPISQRVNRGILIELFELLVSPIWEEVKGVEKIIIIPDDWLSFVPFSSLINDKNSGSYFLESHTISTISSMELYNQIEGRKYQHPGIQIWGGLSYYERNIVHRLDNLPGAEYEAQAINKYFSSCTNTFLGKNASESAFKKYIKKAKVIHIASHAKVNHLNPMESAIFLSSIDDKYSDGVLYAHEIFKDIKIETDLLVLSSCDSATGKTLKGEGVMSLARAFQFAGARSIVATLWPVDDEVTGLFMERFYQYLATGLDKGSALKNAQLSLINEPRRFFSTSRVKKDLSHPYYWAGFQLIGPFD